MAPKASSEQERIRVDTYRPSEYTQEYWPVVSDARQANYFIPSSFDTIGESAPHVDEMFRTFDGMQKGPIELSRDAGEFDIQPVGEAVLEGLSEVVDPHGGENQDEKQPFLGDQELSGIAEQNESTAGDEHITTADGSRLEEESQAARSETCSDALTGVDEGRLRAALLESYERGCADTRQEVIAVQEQLEERYRLLWEDMHTQLDETLRLNEARAVELAMQVARRLVGDVVEHQREYINHVIHEAMKVAAGAEISAVRISPGDYEFLKLADYSAGKNVVAGNALKFISDESIRAGCVLVTSAGEVDYDLDRAWERIKSKAQQEPEL
jgi:flagellar biosynthesis/type III secretory pathway protein FliH